MPNEINTLIFDRSNPDDIVTIIPKGHWDNKTGKAIKVTRREDLRERDFHRCDIAMVNIRYASGGNGQLCAYPNRNGKVIWYETQKYFTVTEQREIERIAMRIYENSKKWPEFVKLLRQF